MKNLVTVIIPVYNRAEYLCEAIESVLTQTYKNYELIIVDDGSKIDIKKNLRPYFKKTNKIKYLKQENNGLAAARNTGIKFSNGNFLVFLDDDDILETDKLKIQSSILNARPNIGFVYSDYYIFYNNDEDNLKLSLTTGRNKQKEEFAKELFLNPNLAVPSLMIRKSCFYDVGLFDESLRQHEDGDMFLRIALKWKVIFSPYSSARVRFHKNKMSANRIEMFKSEIKSAMKILSQNSNFKKYLGEKADERMAELYFCLGEEFFYNSNFKKAIENFHLSRMLSNKFVNVMNLGILSAKFFRKKIQK